MLHQSVKPRKEERLDQSTLTIIIQNIFLLEIEHRSLKIDDHFSHKLSYYHKNISLDRHRVSTYVWLHCVEKRVE